MICVHRLRYLLRGWYLVKEEGRPHLIISQYEDTDNALQFAEYGLKQHGVEALPTLKELVKFMEDSICE